MVERITDGFEASDLPARYKLAVRYADVLIIDPGSLSDELRAALLAELDGNPARTAVAVFVADLDDPVGSEADGSMRATFEGHAPVL